MIVLGIDPGTRATGYGVVEVDGRSERALTFGVIRPGDTADHGLRLDRIYRGLIEVFDGAMPDACAVEMPIFSGNAQAMLKLGRAQAAAMLAAMHREVPVAQYTPAEVKKAVTGNGNAAKPQVGFMIRALLGLAEPPPHDAADALAVALCHARRVRSGPLTTHKNWKSFLEANPDRVR